MPNEKLAVEIPELGYGLKRLNECYQLAKWCPAHVGKVGRAAGKEVPEGWVLEQTYPVSLSGGLRKIAECAMADRLKEADAKQTLAVVKEILAVLEKAGL